jgi:hypothetical protein
MVILRATSILGGQKEDKEMMCSITPSTIPLSLSLNLVSCIQPRIKTLYQSPLWINITSKNVYYIVFLFTIWFSFILCFWIILLNHYLKLSFIIFFIYLSYYSVSSLLYCTASLLSPYRINFYFIFYTFITFTIISLIFKNS